jgi:hypothetical protein
MNPVHKPIGRVALCLAGVLFFALGVAFNALPRYDALLLLPVTWFVASIDLRSEARRTALYFGYFCVLMIGVGCNLWWSYGSSADRHGLLGGVIPWSDAIGFLADATRRNFGELLSATARRPLWLVWLSALLRVFGDLRVVLTIMVGLGVIAASAVASRIAQSAGKLGTFFTLIILYEFLRRYFFVLSTESLGFIFGAIGFLILFRRDVRIEHVFAGVMFMAMGLATRAGPMLIAATTVLFFALRRQWRLALIAASCWVFALAFDASLLTAIREPGVSMGDYGPILYGMLHGHDFTFVMEQHPELAGVPYSERGAFIFRIIMRELAVRPWLAITGPTISLLSFVFGPHGFFSFGFYDPDDLYLEHPSSIGAGFGAIASKAGVYRLANWFSMVLWGAATAISFVYSIVRFATSRNRSTHLEFAGFVLAGIVLSSAFTPPWITEGVQLQSSTLPFLVAFAACTIDPKRAQSPEKQARIGHSLWLWSAPIVALSALLLCAYLPAKWHRVAPQCGQVDPLDERFLLPIEGTFVEVDAKNEHFSRARVELNALYLHKVHSDLAEPLRTFGQPGVAFEATYDACNRRIQVIAGDATLLRAWGTQWAKARLSLLRGVAFVTDVRAAK